MERLVVKIKLMADYSADPIWNDDRDDPECGVMMELDEIPICQATHDRLRRWTDSYESNPTWKSPPNNQWPAEIALAFEKEGRALWALLREELGPGYEVSYFSERMGHAVKHPDELD